MINAPADDTVTVTTPKGPDGYTDAERESKRILDFIAVGGDPNAIDGDPNSKTVFIDTKREPVEESVAPPVAELPPDTTLPSMGQVTITGKKEACPVGTVLNPITGECEPYWDEGNGDTNPTAPTVAKPSATKPSVAKPTVTHPPAAATPLPTIPRFTPSGSYVTTETTDPIYAGAMGDFNLFATLEELLADRDAEKDSKNSKDKTKMATGGHLDDLLAQQMTVDDLLNLLR